MLTHQTIIELVRKDVVPALGCTEPISAVLAVVKAREALGGRIPDRVELFVSPNMYKNGKGVGIPHTSLRGLSVAAALGMVTGDSRHELEVLQGVKPQHVEFANRAVAEGLVSLSIKEGTDKLYVEAVAYADQDVATVVVQRRHNHVSTVLLNGRLLEENAYQEGARLRQDGSYEGMSVDALYDCALQVPLQQIDFIMEAARLNVQVSEEGLSADYGLKVGRRLMQQVDKGMLQADLMTVAMARAAAGSDARMAGCGLPVITNSGSGNQGITITLPVLEVAQREGATDEQLTRALFLAHALPVHIKRRIGPLSALCGVVAASIGAGAGMLLLMGGGRSHLHALVKYMLGNLSGMICDGAKPACALKISSCVGTAVQSVLFALDDSVQPFADGILHDDVEVCIENYARLGVQGMERVDPLLVSVMQEDFCD